LSPEPMWQSRT